MGPNSGAIFYWSQGHQHGASGLSSFRPIGMASPRTPFGRGWAGVTMATWELFFTSGLFPQPRRRTQSRGKDGDWDQQASSAPFRSVW